MIRYLSILAFFFILPNTYAQVALELEKMNVVYIHLANPLNIAVEGYSRNQIRVSGLGNCKVEDADSIYYVKPVIRGECKILIQTLSGDTLAMRSLRSRSIPKPQARLGTLESGSHSSGVIWAQPGIYATLGEGFAYEGVKYLVDSSMILMLTPFELIQCHNRGTALNPIIKRHMGEVLQISINEIHVTHKESQSHLELASLFITNRDKPLEGLIYTPDFTQKPILPSGTCRIETDIRLQYMEKGTLISIQSHKSENNPIPDHWVIRNSDTLWSIREGFYRSFDSTGIILEQGTVGFLHDSILTRNVQSETRQVLGFSFENDTTLILTLNSRFYPVGYWKYFHPNGSIKAEGSYRIDGSKIAYAYHSDIPHYELQINRSGTWKFYDTNGLLLYAINYPLKTEH